ncbi:MAG TPA: acetylornithine/succinylornithine family transaminase [Vicinamibacterales bacterium]|nr:acetylornithine/succinylornithine family transaminase [Vicinamibacterales bacterium]
MRVTLDDIRTREQQHVLQTYKRQPVAFVRGQGSRLYDADGREYLDLLSGIGVTSLGHAHPGLLAIVTEQASTLLHTSNLYYHPFQGQAAARLAQLSGLQRTFFCNSGSEANEANLKFARRYWHTLGDKDRVGYVAVENAFGGRTMGALSVTHDPHYREPFMPLVGPVTFVDPTRPETLVAAVTNKTAAIIAEPIRGESGIRPLPEGFVQAVKDVTAKTGTLLIADEVQSGLGRTGYNFYFQALGWQPDLVSVGKALGSGVPVAAALVSEKVAGAISAGDHGTTYGGNLLSCRAALFFLEQLMDHGLLAHVREVGAHFERQLRALALKHPVIEEVRGAGLMRGLQLTIDATPIIDGARERGLIVNRTNEKVVRMLPPLNIEKADLDRAVEILDDVFAAVPAEVGA